MKKGLISIIIPVFNADKYLSTCIDSILAQSYQNFELILVDDGSTDESGIICDHYQTKDNRIRVFHKTNFGVSHARNYGINVAEGEYLTFIDSDDYIDANYLASYIQHEEYDCVIGSYQTFPIVHMTIHKEMAFSISNDNDLNSLCNYIAKIDGSIWCKLYHHSIINEHHVRFNEQMRFSEDTDFCLNYFRYAKTFKTISSNSYHYRVAEGIQAERKYNLSKEEINHNLSILLENYQELEKIWDHHIDHSNFRIGVACYPIENIYLIQSDEDYYELYYKFYYQANKEKFYKDPICSPFVRTITTIKNYYTLGEREKGKQLMKDFANFYGKNMSTIVYPYPLYKFFSKLVSHRLFIFADIAFTIYTRGKRILNR